MRIQVLSTEAAQYVGFAKRKWALLEATRKAAGLDFMDQIHKINGFTIIVQANSLTGGKVVLMGANTGQMLFATTADEGKLLVYVYDYKTKRLARVGKVAATTSDLVFYPFHNSRSHLTTPTISYGFLKATYKGADIEFEDGKSHDIAAFRTDMATGREYAVSMETGVPVVYARIPGSKFREVVTFPVRESGDGVFVWALSEGDDQRAFQIVNGTLYLAGHWSIEPWNMFNAYEFFGYNPQTEISSVVPWYSDIWFDDSGQFGAIGLSYLGNLGPFKTIESKFGSLLDDRAGRAAGLCEMVTGSESVDGETSFSTQGYFYHGRFGGGRSDFDTNPTAIDYSGHFLPTDDVRFHFWSYVGEGEVPDSGFWAVIAYTDNGKFVVHRHNGYTQESCSGDGYVFHTVSEDGNLLCVESQTGTIVDMLTGEVTQHEKVTGFLAGCFIPEASKEHSVITQAVTLQDIQVNLPSMGEVRPGISQSITMSNTHWKLRTVAPFHVKGFLFNDPCWGWAATAVLSELGGTVVVDGVEYPLTSAPNIVGGTYDGDVLFGKWEGYQRVIPTGGTLTQREDKLDDIRTVPISVSAGVGIDRIMTYQHPPVSLIGTPLGWPDGTLYLSNGKEPVSWSGAQVVEPFNTEVAATGLYGLPVTGCSELTNITATDACGRSATAEVEVEIVPLTISGDGTPEVGDAYAVSGGVPPYTFSISCGTISENGAVTDLSGCCGTGTISVTDDCGETASMDVRFPIGQWVYQGTTYSGTTGELWSCVGSYRYKYEATHYSSTEKTIVGYCCTSLSYPYGEPCGTVTPCCTYCTLYSMDSYFSSDYFRTFIWKRVAYHYTKTYTWECP